MHINDYLKTSLIGKTVFVLNTNNSIYCGEVKDVDEDYVFFQDRTYDLLDFNFHFSLDEFKEELFSEENVEVENILLSERGSTTTLRGVGSLKGRYNFY